MELKNQPIYKGVHKTLYINFRAYAAFFPKIFHKSRWSSFKRHALFRLCFLRYILIYNLEVSFQFSLNISTIKCD